MSVAPAFAQEHQHPAGERIGTVHFQTSCSPTAQQKFDRALAYMHSFEFGPAIAGFTDTAADDPRCAIAYWGVAVARWTNPFAPAVRPPAQLKLGMDAVEAGRKANPKTERERDYLEAVARLYTDAATVDQPTRLAAYEQAMAQLAAKYADDREATIFWALAIAAAAPPTDKTYKNQLKAGAILEKLYPATPDHPGITHYIIHSYDTPALADQAVKAAQRYATIAPAAPHALHMPSHTFTRVGAWQESIDTNIASAAAAERVKGFGEQLHAMDYMVYAYLQTGQDRAADATIARLPSIAAVFDPKAVVGAAPGSAGVFALAAMPARRALERRDWAAAAKLQPVRSDFPYTEAITYFARALGASRTGALDDAKASIAALQEIADRLTKAGENYWAEQVRIQREGAAAHLALAEGRSAEAVSLMTAAAVREDATDKAAVTPGPIAPARELLAEMLLELKRPADALKEFQATLKKEPNRFRAVYGAARAARQAGDNATARTYYAQLIEICTKADTPGRPEIAEARGAVK
ncbi:MAG TPA: hypothetical protein VFO19_04055 [Vicinamibacterales bacterium]|nr:hypothetical protein [Vicinamibacterales bacterium]